MELFRILGTVALRGADDAEAALRQLGAEGERTGNNLSFGDRFTDTIRDVEAGSMALLGIVGALGVAAVGLGARALGVAGNFEQSMNLIAVATGAPQAEMEALQDLAMEIGRTTRFSATQAADAMLELAKGGFTPAQIEGGALVEVLNLAAAGGLELADAAGIVKSSMLTFNIEAENAADITNAFAGASVVGRANVSELAAGFINASARAQIVGVSVNELTGALALMSDAGFVGASAGTYLNNMLQRLAPEAGEARDIMDRLGISFENADGTFKDLVEITRQLEYGFSDLTDVQRNNYLQTIFQQQGMNAANALLAMGSDELTRYIEATHNQTIAAELAEAQMGGWNGAMEQLRGGLDDVFLAIGQRLLPIIAPLVERVTQFTQRVIDFVSSERFGETLQRWSPILAAIAGAITAALIPAVVALGVKLVALMLPIAPLLVAGAALGALIAGIRNSTGPARIALQALAVVVGTLTAAMIAGYVAIKAKTLAKAAASAAGLVMAGIKVIMTVASVAATIAKWAFNIALYANPIMLIVVAAIALVAALVALIAILVRNAGAQERANQRAAEFEEQTKENTRAMRDNLSQLQKSEQGQSDLAQAYYDGINAIERQGRVIADAIRTYRLSSRAIEALTELQDEHVAAVQRRIDITRELEGIQMGYASAQLKVMDAEDRVAEATQNLTDVLARYGEGSREAQRAAWELEDANNRLSQAQNDLAADTHALENATQTLTQAHYDEIEALAEMQLALADTTNNFDEINETLARLYEDGSENSMKLRDQIIADAKANGATWNAETGQMERDNRGVFQRMFDSISGFGDRIRSTITGAFSRARDAVVGVIRGMRDTIGNVFSSIVGLVKRPINAIIRGINSAIRGFNRIQLPSWVPGIGGRGINIPTIPELAKGGILDTATLFVGGEYAGAKNNPEIVAPQSILKETFSEVLDGRNGAGFDNRTYDMLETINNSLSNLKIYLDGKKLVGGIAPEIDKTMRDNSMLASRGVALA